MSRKPYHQGTSPRYSSSKMEPRVYPPGTAAYSLPPKGNLEVSPCRSSRPQIKHFTSPRSQSVSPLRPGATSYDGLPKDSKVLSAAMRSSSAGVGTSHKSLTTPWTPRRPLTSSTPTMSKVISSKTDLSMSDIGIIDKQRGELELILGELRERDRELNEMVAGHQHQLLSWEEDRQRVLTLEHKSTRLQAELAEKTDQMRKMVSRLSAMENEEDRKYNVLENTQKRLQQISDEHAETSLKIEELQSDKDSLNDSIMQMTSIISQMESKEEELLTLLRLKDRDLSEASGLIAELTTKLRRLDSRVQEKQTTSQERKKQAAEWKAKYADSKRDVEKLKSHVKQVKQDNSNFKKDDARQKEEIRQLQRELSLSVEREKRKEELLESQKSKQERTDSELRHLRQLYDRQQKDLHLLHINLESTKDLLGKQREVYSSLRRDSQASQISDASIVTAMTASTSAEKTLLNGVDLASMTTSKAPSEDEHMTLPDKLTSTSVAMTMDTNTTETGTEMMEESTSEECKNLQTPLKCSIDSGVTSIAEKSPKEADTDITMTKVKEPEELNMTNPHHGSHDLHVELQRELQREIQGQVSDDHQPTQRMHPSSIHVCRAGEMDSPTQKLQRLLKESRQLVESLESSSLLNASFTSQQQSDAQKELTPR